MTISRKIKASIAGSLAAICVSAIAIAGTPAKDGTPAHNPTTVDTGSVVEDVKVNENATYDVPDSEAINTDEDSVEAVEAVMDQTDTSVPVEDPKSDSRSVSKNAETPSCIGSKTEDEPSKPEPSASLNEETEPVEDSASDDDPDVEEPKTDSETPDDVADTVTTPKKGTPDAPTRDDIDHLIQDMDDDVLDKMFEDSAVYTPSQFVDRYVEEDPDFQSVVDSYYGD